MNINLNNYEEYFLLYADNELSGSQKKIVEMFVAANPQLSKEFEDILSTVFNPDEISLHDKSFLLKTPMDQFINDENFEEKFVQYHDDELSEEEKTFVDQFIETKKEKSEDFHLIKQARLEPDLSIVFTDKESLYRSSPKVFRIGFVRLLAAAAVTGAIIWIGINRLTVSPEAQQQIAVTENKATVSPESTPKAKTATAIAQANKETADAETEEPALQENTSTKKETPSPAHYASVAKTEEPTVDGAPKINTASDEPGELARGIKLAVTEPKPIVTQATKAVMEDREVFVTSEQPQTVRYVSFELEPEPDEYVFMDIPAETLRRSKVGVLFKKVKRTIDRNNPINRLFNADETY